MLNISTTDIVFHVNLLVMSLESKINLALFFSGYGEIPFVMYLF